MTTYYAIRKDMPGLSKDADPARYISRENPHSLFTPYRHDARLWKTKAGAEKWLKEHGPWGRPGVESFWNGVAPHVIEVEVSERKEWSPRARSGSVVRVTMKREVASV